MSEDQSPYDHGDGEEISAMSIMTEITDRLNQSGDDDAANALARACHVAFERLQVINTLREENAKFRTQVEKLREACKFKNDLIERLGDQRNRLRNALEPLIADVTDDWSGAPDDATVDLFATVWQWRAARAAYEETADPVCKESLHGDNTSKFVDQQSEIGDAQ